MKFSTSVNIERDKEKSFNYIVTANAKQAIGQIVDYIIEDNVFDEWFQLGVTLLKNRKENEEDY